MTLPFWLRTPSWNHHRPDHSTQFSDRLLGQKVYYIDPWRTMRRLGMPSHDFNPVGHLVRYAEKDDPELLSKAQESMLIVQPEPESGGDNRIFITLSRDFLTSVVSFLATEEAATGEICCNLPYLNTVVCGSAEDLDEMLQRMRRSPLYSGSFRRAANRFLVKLQRSPRTAESILTSCQDALRLYDPAGPLGRTIDVSSFDARDLKNPNTPTSIFLIIPPDKAATYGSYFGLCLNSLIDTCIAADSFVPRVTAVIDEFPNIAEGKLPAILPTLFIGRSRGVQAITYVQDTESYSRYGREASAFTTQSEFIVAWSIRSTKDAKDYSDRSGMRSVIGENIESATQRYF